MLLELIEGNRVSALDVAGLELVRRADVDEDDVAAPQPLQQLLAADRLDLLAEVVARRALDLAELRGGGVAKREPERAAPSSPASA